MRTVLIYILVMESMAVTAWAGETAAAAEREPESERLSALHPGQAATVVFVGSQGDTLSALERRLLELGFIAGERVEVVAEARPGRDPFVVRVGSTTLALRRREAENIWVSARDPSRRP
jgi:ferrous iron transport protein A